MTEVQEVASKACTTCAVSKPRTKEHWHPRPDSRDGFTSVCRTCRNAGRRAKTAIHSAILYGTGPIPRTPIGDDEVTEPAEIHAREPMALSTIEPERSERYVVTYAQNATPVHDGFLASLLVYCAENSARLVVLPGRYKNPTSVWSKDQEHDEWWASELAPYLFAGRMQIGKLTVYGDISIQPTAARPVNDFEVFAGHSSAVFGHPKIQLKTVASAERNYPRIMTSTGAVTRANYTASKAGKKGEAHHVFGACVIERDPHLFHLRQINALDDGSFIDLDREYTPTGSLPAARALALILGDVHVDKISREVEAATLRRVDSIAETLRPERIVYHDTLDFDARNHHTIESFTDRYDRAKGLRNDSVEAEVMRAIAFLDSTPAFATPVVVRSNHDEAFDKWLRTADPKKDPVNARFYYECMTESLRAHSETGKHPDAFALLYRLRGTGRAQFLAYDEPLKVADVYLHFHGHHGLNGARGSPLTFAKLGAAVVTGHVHSPSILDGAYAVGLTGEPDQGYNHTPSSWLNTHCVIYANGKRSLINVVRGAWRTRPAPSRLTHD